MSRSRSSFPLLWCLFCASGAAALIYEIVWFQLIQLVIGSSGISLGVLLGTFMGGMCAGSLALARFVSTDWHPLGVYSALEFGIGLCGLGLLFLLPYAARGYVVWGVGLPGLFGRVLLCGLALLPPTVLMGATLPTVSRWLGRLVRDGVLIRIARGTQATQKANEFRYIGETNTLTTGQHLRSEPLA